MRILRISGRLQWMTLLTVGLLLSACGQSSPESVALAPSADNSPSLPNGEVDLSDNPEEVLSETLIEPVNECLVCHQDKDRLIDTAKVEEEVVSENKGQG